MSHLEKNTSKPIFSGIGLDEILRKKNVSFYKGSKILDINDENLKKFNLSIEDISLAKNKLYFVDTQDKNVIDEKKILNYQSKINDSNKVLEKIQRENPISLNDEDFCKKICELKQFQNHLILLKKIITWYKENKVDIDEIYHGTIQCYKNNKVYFIETEQTMYNDFIESLYIYLHF